MNVGVIIPDRGDRPGFLENCYRMLSVQTLKPAYILPIDHEPDNEKCDITQRYRVGYEFYCKKKTPLSASVHNSILGGVDVIACIENDDWYAHDYIETMVKEWQKHGKPDLFGTNYTIYYHLKLKKYYTMRHDSRASMMNTLIKPDLKFEWCPDHEPFTDLHFWINVKGITKKVFEPDHIIAVGMKHGIGLCGGRQHVDKLHRYINDDRGFLKNTLDQESFDFYSKF